jgi:hypothetical protein
MSLSFRLFSVTDLGLCDVMPEDFCSVWGLFCAVDCLERIFTGILPVIFYGERKEMNPAVSGLEDDLSSTADEVLHSAADILPEWARF